VAEQRVEQRHRGRIFRAVGGFAPPLPRHGKRLWVVWSRQSSGRKPRHDERGSVEGCPNPAARSPTAAATVKKLGSDRRWSGEVSEFVGLSRWRPWLLPAPCLWWLLCA